MSDAPPFIRAEGLEREAVTTLVNALIESTEDYVDGAHDKALALALLQTAAAVFAGSLYGAMVAAGVEPDDRARRKQAASSAARNFLAGVTASQERAARVMRRQAN